MPRPVQCQRAHDAELFYAALLVDMLVCEPHRCLRRFSTSNGVVVSGLVVLSGLPPLSHPVVVYFQMTLGSDTYDVLCSDLTMVSTASTAADFMPNGYSVFKQ